MVNDGSNAAKAHTETSSATDRPAAEEAVRLRIERDIDRQLLRSTSVGALIDGVCDLLTGGPICASAAVLLWDGDGTIIDSAQADPSGVLADLSATTTTDMLPTSARPALDTSSRDTGRWRKPLNGDIHLFPLQQAERAIGLLAVVPASSQAGIPGDLQWMSALADDMAVGILRLQQGASTHNRFRMESLLPDDQSELIKGIVYRCRNDSRWTMTALSGSVFGITGYRVEQLIDNREAAYGDLIDPAYRDWVWAKVQEGVDQNQPFKITYPIRKASGERRWVWERGRGVRDAADRAAGLEGFITDITDLKKAEEALRESEARYRLLADNTLDIIWQMDMDLRITYVNPAVEDILGYAHEAFIGTALSDHCSPATLETVRAAITQGLAEENRPTRRTLTIPFVHRNGSEVPLEIQARFLFDTAPGPVGIQGTARDISERLAAEKALQATEATLRAALDHSQAGIAITDPQGTLTYVNHAGLAIRGKVPEEVVEGVGVDDYVQSWQIRHRDGRPYEKDEVPLARAVLFKETASAVFLIRRDDGEDRVVKANAAPVLDHGGAMVGAIVVFMDITEQAAMEEQLRRTSHRLTLATEAAGLGIWEWDPKRDTLIWDERMDVLYDRNPESAPPCFDDWQKALHPEDRDRAVRAVEDALAGQQPFNTQFRIRLQDGAVRHIEARAAVTHDRQDAPDRMIGVNWDITDRVEAEAAARRQKELLQTIMDSIPLMVTFIDAQGRHRWVNQGWERTLGWTQADIDGKDILRESYPDPEYRRYVLDFIQRAEGRWRDFETRTADGRVRKTVWKNVRLTDGSVIGIGEDVTDARQASKHRQELEEQLRQAQKMEAVGRLAGGVAHDFNNLLAIILGYAELILETLDSADSHYEPVQDIFDAATRARDLTRQLLAFGRKQVLTIEVLDVNTVIEGFDKLIRRVIGEDIVLDLKLARAPLTVRADVSQLEQVLMNLAVNARDAMPDGGRLTIETTSVELDGDYAAETPGTRPGDYALIAVSDTGSGMDPATLRRIFEPFYTTKGQDAGTGLGLSTAYGIVKQHRGNIWAYSEPGRGTSFKVYLPLAGGEQRTANDVPSSAVPADSSVAATILVAEDDPNVRRLVDRILSRKGYRVLTAGSIAEAVRIGQDHVGLIDLLLTDVIMPGMTGPELFAQLSSVRPELKVIFMSGYSGEAVSRHGVLKPDTHFLQKPFSTRCLLTKVSEALAG